METMILENVRQETAHFVRLQTSRTIYNVTISDLRVTVLAETSAARWPSTGRTFCNMAAALAGYKSTDAKEALRLAAVLADAAQAPINQAAADAELTTFKTDAAGNYVEVKK